MSVYVWGRCNGVLQESYKTWNSRNGLCLVTGGIRLLFPFTVYTPSRVKLLSFLASVCVYMYTYTYVCKHTRILYISTYMCIYTNTHVYVYPERGESSINICWMNEQMNACLIEVLNTFWWLSDMFIQIDTHDLVLNCIPGTSFVYSTGMISLNPHNNPIRHVLLFHPQFIGEETEAGSSEWTGFKWTGFTAGQRWVGIHSQASVTLEPLVLTTMTLHSPEEGQPRHLLQAAPWKGNMEVQNDLLVAIAQGL